MTTIKREDIKTGDRIRWTREATVVREERAYGRRLQPMIEVRDDDGRTCFLDPTRPQTLELLERPLPEEPPLGTVVLTGIGVAYQRGASLPGVCGWQPTSRSRLSRTWRELCELAPITVLHEGKPDA